MLKVDMSKGGQSRVNVVDIAMVPKGHKRRSPRKAKNYTGSSDGTLEMSQTQTNKLNVNS